MTIEERWAGLTDRELVARAAQAATRQVALAAIYERYHRRILAYCAAQLHEKGSAVDAAADSFTELTQYFADGKTLTNPEALGGFLYTIAKRRSMRYMRDGRPGQGHGQPLDPLGVRDVSEMHAFTAIDSAELASAEDTAGIAHIHHLLDTYVVTTFTSHHRRIYEYSVRQGLRGQALANSLEISADRAKNTANYVQKLAETGFGAWVLFRDGRHRCPDLDRIIETAIARDGDMFTTQLREQITKHFDNCPTCQSCAVCNPLRRRLVAPYAPALIPVLYAADLRERVMETIRRICATERLASPPPPTYRQPPARPTQQSQRRRRSKMAYILLILFLIGGTLVLGRAVAPLLPGDDPQSAAAPDVLPASLAGTWQLEPFTDSSTPGVGTRTSQWIFAGSCDQVEVCSYTWEPIDGKTSTTFEHTFTVSGRRDGFGGAAWGGTLSVQFDKDSYTGTGTGTYGLASVSADDRVYEFGIAKTEVTLHIHVTQTELREGKLIATRFTVAADYRSYDFRDCDPIEEPCINSIKEPSDGDYRGKANSTASRIS